ncbi:MAG: prepilin peptidase [Clostridiales bacterium]|nr:prepilin peptidase [Clostridiales bacterium]
MEKIKEWFAKEWTDKKFRRYAAVWGIISAALLAEFIWFGYSLPKLFRYLILLEAVFGIAWIDGKTKRIPNKILIALLVFRTVLLGIEWAVYPSLGLSILISSALGAVIGGGMFLLCFFLTRGGMGMGDVKLFTIIGYFVGSGVIMPIVFFTVMISALYSIIQLIRKKTKLKDEIPFAPFALAGMILAMGLGM